MVKEFNPMGMIFLRSSSQTWGGRRSSAQVSPWTLRLRIALALVILSAPSCRRPSAIVDPTPIDVSAAPRMAEIPSPEILQMKRSGFDFAIKLKADYVVRGIVVSREGYRWDPNALLSPMDVALCWGNLAEEDLYKQVTWSQGGRWYFWRHDVKFPLSNDLIRGQSSNNHIIPATPNLARALKTLKKGDRVEMSGYLVDVDGRKGAETFQWRSSASTSDHGAGSCEIIYLKRLKRSAKVFE